jgi:hypothetical protein
MSLPKWVSSIDELPHVLKSWHEADTVSNSIQLAKASMFYFSLKVLFNIGKRVALICRPSPSMNRIRSVASLGNLLALGDDNEVPHGCLGTCLGYCVPSFLIPTLIVISDLFGALASGELTYVLCGQATTCAWTWSG